MGALHRHYSAIRAQELGIPPVQLADVRLVGKRYEQTPIE